MGRYCFETIRTLKNGGEKMKVALVHDWLNGMRGGEYVLESLADIYPEAEIYTLFYDAEKISRKIKSHRIVTSYIQRLPLRKSRYRNYLPLFPGAVEKFKLGGKELIVSTSHCVAKGAIGGESSLHICYCFSPMRYVWDRFDDYFPQNRTNFIKHKIISFIARRLRSWDVGSSGRVDLFIADSNFVRKRIETYYARPSKVIFPPVDTDFYTPGESRRDGYFLLAGAMVPYKKGEIVINAFKGADNKLVVTGEGPEMDRLAKMATDNIKFTGWINKETLRDYYRGCNALIFPGVEDFGIIPVEAQACGRPIIAFGEGGILDTVVGPTIDDYRKHDGFKSGLFFKEQTADAVREAVEVFKKLEFDGGAIVKHAREFSKIRFESEIRRFIYKAVETFVKSGRLDIEERMLD